MAVMVFRVYGLCECGCGKQTRIAKTNNKRWGHVKGQPVRFIKGHHTRKNIVGKKFGRLTVFGEEPNTRPKKYKCRCTCGAIVLAQSGALLSGGTKSCGCGRREWAKSGQARYLHGHAGANGTGRSLTYQVWLNMKGRCYNPNNNRWYRYGARGITVCDRWRESFEAFLAAMGEKPDGLSIDRIDNDGHYSCGQCDQCASNSWGFNCRWATRKQQMNNKTQRISRVQQ